MPHSPHAPWRKCREIVNERNLNWFQSTHAVERSTLTSRCTIRIDRDAMAVRGGQTRNRIIDAAYRMFYRERFFRAGVDAIAEAAHVTKRTLHYHFDSKDSLLAAVLTNQNDLALGRIRRWAGSLETWVTNPSQPSIGHSSANLEFARWHCRRGTVPCEDQIGTKRCV